MGKNRGPRAKRVAARAKANSLVYEVLSKVNVGERILVGSRRDKSSTLVADWSLSPMQGQGMRLADVTYDHVKNRATSGGKKPLGKDKQRQLAVGLAWKSIRLAQESSVVTMDEHPEVYKALRARQACDYPDGDDLRNILVLKHGFLAVGAGLAIRASEAYNCKGLFATKSIQKNQLVTYYDGVAVALTQTQLQQHSARSGWFICVGRSSKTSPVIVGFTSSDAIPRNAGVMSLTNSAKPPHANCERFDVGNQTYRHGDAFLSSLICLRAVRDIRVGEELTWNYNVR